MGDIVLITFTGNTRWATINGLWALVEEENIVPDRIIALHTSPITEDAKDTRSLLATFISGMKGCTLIDESIPTDDVQFMRKMLEDIIKKERSKGSRIFIDMTSARKLVALSMMASPSIKEVERLSYLHVDNLENADRPYPMIPFKRQVLLSLEAPK